MSTDLPRLRAALDRRGGLSHGRVRRIGPAFLLVLTVLLPLAILPVLTSHDDPLDRLALAGARGPACVRLVILPDVSGSMADYAAVRAEALRQVIAWAPGNLRPDDEVAVIRWDDRAELVMKPTPVDDLARVPDRAGRPLGGSGSDVGQALKVLAQLAPTVCHTSLIAITDTIVEPLDSSTTDQLLRDAGVGGIDVILPLRTDVSQEWMATFPSTRMHVAAPDDPTMTARSVGEAVAAATGQSLERRER